MVHPKHEEGIEGSQCKEYVNLCWRYSTFTKTWFARVCNMFQSFNVGHDRVVGTRHQKKTQVLWALHGRQIDINFAQSSPTQSMKAKTWVPSKICLIQSWKINVLHSQTFGGLVWLVQMIFRISLGWFFGVPALNFHGCMPSLGMLHLGYHPWSSVWKLTIPMGSRNGNLFVLFFFFFRRFFGSHKIYGNVCMYIWFRVHAIHTSPDVCSLAARHTFQFNRSSVWCWRRLWRFLLVIIPVRKAQKHWDGEVSEGDDSQVFVGELGRGEDSPFASMAVYVISRGFLECDCTTSFKKQHWTFCPTVDPCMA